MGSAATPLGTQGCPAGDPRRPQEGQPPFPSLSGSDSKRPGAAGAPVGHRTATLGAGPVGGTRGRDSETPRVPWGHCVGPGPVLYTEAGMEKSCLLVCLPQVTPPLWTQMSIRTSGVTLASCFFSFSESCAGRCGLKSRCALGSAEAREKSLETSAAGGVGGCRGVGGGAAWRGFFWARSCFD